MDSFYYEIKRNGSLELCHRNGLEKSMTETQWFVYSTLLNQSESIIKYSVLEGCTNIHPGRLYMATLSLVKQELIKLKELKDGIQ